MLHKNKNKKKKTVDDLIKTIIYMVLLKIF